MVADQANHPISIFFGARSGTNHIVIYTIFTLFPCSSVHVGPCSTRYDLNLSCIAGVQCFDLDKHAGKPYFLVPNIQSFPQKFPGNSNGNSHVFHTSCDIKPNEPSPRHLYGHQPSPVMASSAPKRERIFAHRPKPRRRRMRWQTARPINKDLASGAGIFMGFSVEFMGGFMGKSLDFMGFYSMGYHISDMNGILVYTRL